jgi:hypothetical protein
MRTVAQINSVLSTYLPVADGHSAATSILPMLNQVLPRLYNMGNWRALQQEVELDVSAGYICLPEDYESLLSVRINDIPAEIRGQHYEYQTTGPGFLERPVSFFFGLTDEGFIPTMSDLPITGLDEMIFTLINGTWDSSDSIRVEYVTEDGRFVWTPTLTGLSTITLTPAEPILSVQSIQYTSMPNRVTVKDSDDYLYAVLMAGDGVTEYRRYSVPQVPENPTGEWTISGIAKQKFRQLTSNTDIVYLDNTTVLKHAFLGITAEDNADLDRATYHWSLVEQSLQKELSQSRGGAKGYPQIEIWGAGNKPINPHF